MKLHKLILFNVALTLCTAKAHAQLSFTRLDTLNDFDLATGQQFNDTLGLLFLTGELHGVASNPISEYYSLKFFVKYHHVKTILLESGFTDSYLLNNFLTSGDSDFLNLYVSDYPSKYYEIRDALLQTRSFYNSLPITNRFRYLGIDMVENDDQPYGFHLLNLLAHKSVNNPQLKSELIQLNLIDSFPKNMETYESLLLKYKPFADYDPALVEIFNSYKKWLSGKKDLFKNRQYYLYQNVITKTSTIKTGNFYGQFGYGHIDLRQKCMAYFINTNRLFQNKVFTIYPFYYNCNSSFFELKKNVGYNRIFFKSKLKKLNLPKGVYVTRHKKTYYTIHIEYKEMQELTW